MDFDVTRKLGPLPVWAWAVLGVGGVLAFNYVSGGRLSSMGSPAEQAPSVDGSMASALEFGGTDGGRSDLPPAPAPVPVTPTPKPSSKPTPKPTTPKPTTPKPTTPKPTTPKPVTPRPARPAKPSTVEGGMGQLPQAARKGPLPGLGGGPVPQPRNQVLRQANYTGSV